MRNYFISVGLIGGTVCGALLGYWAGRDFPFWGGLWSDPGVLSRSHALVFGLAGALLGVGAGALVAADSSCTTSAKVQLAVLFVGVFLAAAMAIVIQMYRQSL